MGTDKKFIKGFNAGYLLAKHKPKLSQTLKRGMQESENPYVQGFHKGTLEYNKEQVREKIKSNEYKGSKDINRKR